LQLDLGFFGSRSAMLISDATSNQAVNFPAFRREF
jgi:hypothetical protein